VCAVLDEDLLPALNIGAGHSFIPGLTNIDIVEWADVSLDLSKDRLPFEDSSIQTIVSIATLEHVTNHLFALGEMYRVLKHDGALLLTLPYVTSTEHHLVNPYHLHNYNERFVDLFDPLLLKESAVEGGDMAFRAVYEEFLYLGYFGIAPRPIRTWARRHLFNIVRTFDIGIVAVKDDRPVNAGADRASTLKAQMRQLKRAREAYPGVKYPRRRVRRDIPRWRKRVLRYRERLAS
jgi:SAM-dependent methyltransferase